MHGTFRQDQPGEAGGPIKGTFYPSQSRHGGGSALPKLLAILVAMAVIRNVVATVKRNHGGGSHWSRRREAIADLHRELHAGDATAQSADDVKA